MNKYECERCHKELKEGDVHSINDDMVCLKCKEADEELAEYMYESQKENEATGN
jgi:hypothetical protein